MNTFARRVFQVAGIYGLIVMLPQYFLEQRIGRDAPPAITHPEYFYGFIGVVVAWQLCFLAIARDPVRLRLPVQLDRARLSTAHNPQFAPNAPEPLTWGIRFICHELVPRSGRVSSRVERASGAQCVQRAACDTHAVQ